MKKLSFSELMAHYKESSLLGYAQAGLNWDKETMMPEGAIGGRAEVLEVMAKVSHRHFTDPNFVESVLQAESGALSPEAARQLERLQLEVSRATAFDADFVGKLAKLQTETHQHWVNARKEKKFSLVEPYLGQLVALSQEVADRLKAHKLLQKRFAGRTRYEVLLDEYEPGFSASELRALLGKLESGTREILPQILEHQRGKTATTPACFRMAPEQQLAADRRISERLGLDFKRARLDLSVHPFCTNLNDDHRITTRCQPNDLSESLYGVIHETGHALYEQGLPARLHNTPCGKAASMGVHESQSRFWENVIGRSEPFSKWLAQELGAPGEAKAVHQWLNRVQPSFIRTEADEVTYNLHIALRFRLEEELIEGKLAVKDLPAKWNSDFERSLGLAVTDDSVGCMQDIHWHFGAFGYFPTYSLGNLLAAELFQDLKKELPDWEAKVSTGEFAPILAFLRSRVHEQASLSESPGTMAKALGGRKIGADAFLAYAREKYLN